MSENIPPKTCPGCGEPVEPGWKMCPVCEISLMALCCPQCGRPVKENWKRCPECTASLICKSCAARIPAGYPDCPVCNPAATPPVVDGDVLREPLTEMGLVKIPGGTFQMGDIFDEGIDNEKPVHPVSLDDFYMGQHVVTQHVWNRIMPENPSRFTGDLLPVEQISWHQAMAFIEKLNQANRLKGRYSLPTEAQWEYAARSCGRDERYAGCDSLDRVGWYADNSGERTHPVGEKEPNGPDLYDMSGNVWEWCLDAFHPQAYAHHAPQNPLEKGEGADRVIRGGSYNLDDWSARCTRRFCLSEDFFGPGVGFRVVFLPDPG
ncbi:MAG: SUMF1/EgtB/PvdO family nonheme iron enzyme [Desulfatirhabdiaceae bacterium]